MKLSDRTINLLRNFSTINQSILFKKGTKLRTISVMKNILAEANVDEDFPHDFAIYDLPQFLNQVNLFKEPEFHFNSQTSVKLREDGDEAVAFFADPSVIVSPPEKSISLPTEDVCFKLDSTQLQSLLKASAVYQLPDLVAVGEAGVVKLVVRDKKNDTSNEYSINVGETDQEFNFNFKVENIKILPGTYEVVISQKLLARFVNNNFNLTYYIALEPDSTFG